MAESFLGAALPSGVAEEGFKTVADMADFSSVEQMSMIYVIIYAEQRKVYLDHAADIQDRDGAVDVLKAIRNRFPWLRHVFADGGYAGDKLRDALRGKGDWTLEIIKRSDKARGFEVLPRRWVVERTFAWLGRCRRLAKDWEQSIESSTAWATIASIRMLTRRISTGYQS
jgi:transposase